MAVFWSWLEVLALATLVVSAATESDRADRTHYDSWTYEGDGGPDQWREIGFSNCAGQRQSPINVVTNRVVLKRFKPLRFRHFEKAPLSLNFSNNYHTATAQMSWDQVPMVSGGGLPGEYEVANFHFHWGKDDFKGSEHTIDGESYPLEMHVVFKNTKYAQLTDALHHADGLAVLGVMYEVREVGGFALQQLDAPLANITLGGATIEVEEPPTLLEMMPADVSSFYRYEGSLTTPGCHEAVTWTVFLETVSVSAKQLALFRALKKNPAPIGYNYRPPQRRYGRDVYLSTADEPPTNQVSVQAKVGAVRSAARRWEAIPMPLLLLLMLLPRLRI